MFAKMSLYIKRAPLRASADAYILISIRSHFGSPGALPPCIVEGARSHASSSSDTWLDESAHENGALPFPQPGKTKKRLSEVGYSMGHFSSEVLLAHLCFATCLLK